MVTGFFKDPSGAALMDVPFNVTSYGTPAVRIRNTSSYSNGEYQIYGF
jgi:hypothetical protein